MNRTAPLRQKYVVRNPANRPSIMTGEFYQNIDTVILILHAMPQIYGRAQSQPLLRL